MIRKDDSPKKITFTEIAKGLNQGLESADPARLAGLQTLQRVRAVKDTSLAREQGRLAKKYGGQHPRVQAIAAKREANRALQRDLEVAVQRAQTPAVTPDPNAWTLHGYVRDAAFHGIHHVEVALYDDKKRWIEELGYACTDANGYFRLTTTAGAAPQAEEAPGVEDVQEKLSRAAAGKPAGRFYIHVTNADDITLHIDEEPVTPKLGEVVYREIILAGDVEACPPPGGGKPTKPTRGGGKDTGKGAGKDTVPAKEGRYLGNRRKKELHDLSNAKPACRIDEIAAAQREYFSNQKQAVAAGYDLCGHCFGKEKSKH